MARAPKRKPHTGVPGSPKAPGTITYLRTRSRSDRKKIARAIDRERRDAEQSVRLSRTVMYQRISTRLKDLTRVRTMHNLKEILPAFFRINNDPFMLDDYPMFEPLYATEIPRRITLITARQMAKSTNQAGQGLMMSLLIPGLHTLFLTPLYEQIRKFSSNYVHDMMSSSPVRGLFIDKGSSKNVLQRTLPNRSTMFFSFALRDADRVRGIPVDKLAIDEVQGMDMDLLPVISSTMTGSRIGPLEQMTGTPKTLDNTAHRLVSESSWAEWVVPCYVCGYRNIPSMEFDLEKMLGPFVPTHPISKQEPGVSCAKCGRPVSPRDGAWIHRYEDRRTSNAGYHMGQPILPLHCEDEERWLLLQSRRRGEYNFDQASFVNEILGEACDSADRLVTETDLRKAAILGPNDFDMAVQIPRSRYKAVVLGVDWGGGGTMNQKYIRSFTALAVCGMLPDGKIEIIYGWRCPTPHDHNREVSEILKVVHAFGVSHIAHDFNGAGSVRETLLINSGVPLDRSVPIVYTPFGTGPLMKRVPYSEVSGKRSYFRLDKSRSLFMMSELIRRHQIFFFQYDYTGSSGKNMSLLHDWLSLIEDKIDRRYTNNAHTVMHDPLKGPDDFADACTMGCFALYELTGMEPNVTLNFNMPSTEELNMIIGPHNEYGQMIDDSDLLEAPAREAVDFGPFTILSP